MNKGFSLLEIIVVLGIFVIVSFILGNLMSKSYRLNLYGQDQISAVAFARKSVETMAEEIRKMNPGAEGSYPLIEAGRQTLSFYSDIDNDGITEKVRYFLEGTNFKKGVIEPSGYPLQYLGTGETITTLSQYVRNDTTSVFTYYNGNWPEDTINNPLTIPVNITTVKLIHFFLRINVHPLHLPDNFDLESSAQIRNLKENL